MEKYAQLSRKDVREMMKSSYNRFRNLVYKSKIVNLQEFTHYIVNTEDDVRKLPQLLAQGYDSEKLADEIVNHGSIELNQIYVEYHKGLMNKNKDKISHIFERYQYKVVTKGDFEKFKNFCRSGYPVFPSVQEEIIRRHCRPLMTRNPWLEILFRLNELSEPALRVLALTDCHWAWKKYREYHDIPKSYRRLHFWRGFIKLFSP